MRNVRRASRCPGAPDSATLAVPTSTGWPVPCTRRISSTTSGSFSRVGREETSGWSTRICRPVSRQLFHLQVVDAAELHRLRGAVAVMPQTLGYSSTRFCSVIDPSTRPCASNATPSLASIAVCSPAGQRRSQRHAPFELVHHLDGPVLHHVVHVAVQQGVRVQRLLHGFVNGRLPSSKRLPHPSALSTA